MSTKQALFTGTFDPFHIGHTLQMRRAVDAFELDGVLVAIIRHNDKKPNAVSWKHRVALAELTLESLDLPFAWRVTSIENILLPTLMQLVRREVNISDELIRVIGSDSLIEFTDDEQLRPALSAFSYGVTLRPETDRGDVDVAIDKLGPGYDITIIPIPESDHHIKDISARNLRTDVPHALTHGLLSTAAVDYMKEHKLYSFAEEA